MKLLTITKFCQQRSEICVAEMVCIYSEWIMCITSQTGIVELNEECKKNIRFETFLKIEP